MRLCYNPLFWLALGSVIIATIGWATGGLANRDTIGLYIFSVALGLLNRAFGLNEGGCQ